jgi:glycerophosphoryl diester phosphodiesterase
MRTIIAHRGASAEQRENTLGAFERAIALGAHYLEFDLHLTRDGIPICHHDPQLLHHGPLIEELTRLEVEQLDPLIPTLADILRLERDGTGLMVELKRGLAPEELIRAALSLLPLEDQTICVGSLCPEMVSLVARQWPHERVIAIVESERDLVEKRGMVALSWEIATPDCILSLKREEQTVWVWTVDEMEQAQQLLSWGADGIITNDPAALIGVL